VRARKPSIKKSLPLAERNAAWKRVANERRPEDLGWLLAQPWPGKWEGALARLLIVVKHEGDPRVAHYLARLVDELPFDTWASMRVYRVACGYLGTCADERALPALERTERPRRHNDERDYRALLADTAAKLRATLAAQLAPREVDAAPRARLGSIAATHRRPAPTRPSCWRRSPPTPTTTARATTAWPSSIGSRPRPSRRCARSWGSARSRRCGWDAPRRCARRARAPRSPPLARARSPARLGRHLADLARLEELVVQLRYQPTLGAWWSFVTTHPSALRRVRGNEDQPRLDPHERWEYLFERDDDGRFSRLTVRWLPCGSACETDWGLIDALASLPSDALTTFELEPSKSIRLREGYPERIEAAVARFTRAGAPRFPWRLSS
jgi:hypothetical protein